MNDFSLLNNVLLRLCLPLLPPALIGARIGVLVCVLVGVSTRRRVETIAHPLTISAPPHPVGSELHGYIEPLVKVLIATIPSKDIWEVIAAALTDLVPDPNKGFRLSIIESWLQLCSFVILGLSIGRRRFLLVLRVGYSLGIVLDNRLVGSQVWAEM